MVGDFVFGVFYLGFFSYSGCTRAVSIGKRVGMKVVLSSVSFFLFFRESVLIRDYRM